MELSKTKVSDILQEYKFDNGTQLRSIAEELGYNVEYNKGHYYFERSDDRISLSTGEIRNYTNIDHSTIQDKSKDELCKFFDKNQVKNNDYLNQLSEKYISIVWHDSQKTNNNFTVIDHNNKVSYSGQSLFNHAFDNGFQLDGKGTQLEAGVMSDLIDINGKKGKMRINNEGIGIFYKKEKLVIPDSVLGHKLSKKEKELLLEGKTVHINKDKKDLYLQVDKDINSVIVKTNKELKIPKTIGEFGKYPGHQLSDIDKFLIANGQPLKNILIGSEKGFFISDVKLTDDKKGISFGNIQTITDEKAKEIIQQFEKEKNTFKTRDLEMELKEAINKNDYTKMASLREEGYKPSEEFIRGLKDDSHITEKQSIALEKVFGITPVVVKSEEQTSKEAEINRTVVTPSPEIETVKGTIKEDVIENISSVNLVDNKEYQTFKEAALNNNFDKITEMKNNGFVLTTDMVTDLKVSGIGENTFIAIQKVFGLKAEKGNGLNDIQLASGNQINKGKNDLQRPIANTINKLFGDL